VRLDPVGKHQNVLETLKHIHFDKNACAGHAVDHRDAYPCAASSPSPISETICNYGRDKECTARRHQTFALQEQAISNSFREDLQQSVKH
jgi:hypothetical protein